VTQGPTKAGGVRSPEDRANVRVGALCAAMAVGMVGLAYAAVPLYAMFCQATGYGGTTQRVVKASEVVLDRTIQVLFDANVGNQLPWKFEPVQRSLDVKLGETAMAFYRATNTSDKPVTGTAAFNVDPPAAGIHFNKIACFCFTEQTLQPGESVDMPVTFYVDPALATDKDAASIKVIVLSYTFFPGVEAKPTKASEAKPTKASEAKPTKASEAKPTKASEAKPTKAVQYESATESPFAVVKGT
jgi:cytochrome c oxidase assembly protein subunit 11